MPADYHRYQRGHVHEHATRKQAAIRNGRGKAPKAPLITNPLTQFAGLPRGPRRLRRPRRRHVRLRLADPDRRTPSPISPPTPSH